MSTENTGTTGTVTSAPVNLTRAGDLDLAFVTNDGPTGLAQTSTVSSGGLTWTLVSRANTQRGDVDIYKARAYTAVTGLTFTATAGITGYHQSISIRAYPNAISVGAATTASASTGTPAATLTTTVAGSVVVGAGIDGDHATAHTVGAGQMMLYDHPDTPSSRDYWL